MTKHTNATVTSTSAAIYLRMSTASQNYSNHHQRAAIAQYARENAMEIVREYADDGKSGLDIRRRAGLSRLIRDVPAGSAAFKVIIVYDVSRWGRFQDVDEAAYHEHTCGAPVSRSSTAQRRFGMNDIAHTEPKLPRALE